MRHRQEVTRLLLVAVACWLAGGCSSLGEASFSPDAGANREAPAEASGGERDDRVLIRRASIEITVPDLREAARRVREVTVAAEGTVLNASISRKTYASFSLRVPAKELDATLDVLAQLGEEQLREISATDVTNRVIDLEAQLRNKKALRDRLRDLLMRAAKIEDALSIEKELSRVQTEIDSLEAQLARTRSEVAMASIQVRLNEKVQKPRRILGPLGYLYVGTAWFIKKLFIIRP